MAIKTLTAGEWKEALAGIAASLRHGLKLVPQHIMELDERVFDKIDGLVLSRWGYASPRGADTVGTVAWGCWSLKSMAAYNTSDVEVYDKGYPEQYQMLVYQVHPALGAALPDEFAENGVVQGSSMKLADVIGYWEYVEGLSREQIATRLESLFA